MTKFATLLVFLLIFIPGFLFVRNTFFKPTVTGAPPYAIEDLEPPEIDPYAWIRDWKRADGPPRVGIQAGHWKNEELPDELQRLRGNTGSSGGGKWEWEVNLSIAEKTKTLLEKENIIVDILPATIPPKYWADVFISIHADGSESRSSSGYKIAAPRRDYTHKTEKLLTLIQNHYGQATKLILDPNVTRNMRGYYAFAWWRYEHAVHPMTASVILETGFLTSPADRRVIVNQPHLSAQGIANGIIEYFRSEKLLSSSL